MPISAPDSPSRIAALPKDAAVEQIRMSAARHSARPAPTQGPLTAAMTGCGSARMACGSAAMVSWNRSRSIAGAVASSMPGPKSRMSIPEQKPRPVPVRTTACTSGRRPDRPGLRQFSLHDLVDGVELFRAVQSQDGDAAAGLVEVSVAAMSHPLDDRRGTHAAAGAHRDQPVARSRRSSSSRMVPMSIAPVAPIGWPSAMAPPLTLTMSGSIRGRGSSSAGRRRRLR